PCHRTPIGGIGAFQSTIGCRRTSDDATESTAADARRQPEIPTPCPFPLRVCRVGVACVDGVGGGGGLQPAAARKATLAVPAHHTGQPAGQLRYAHQLLSPRLWALLHYGVNGNRRGFLRLCRAVLAGYGEQGPWFHDLPLAAGRAAVSCVIVGGNVLPGPPYGVEQLGRPPATGLRIFLPAFSVQRLVFLCLHGAGATWVQSYGCEHKTSEGHILVIRVNMSDQLPPFRALVGYACLALCWRCCRRGGAKHCLGTMAP